MTHSRNASPGESVKPVSYRGIAYDLNCFIAYYTLMVGWLFLGGFGYSLAREPWKAKVVMVLAAIALIALGVKRGLSPQLVKSRAKFHGGHGLMLTGTLFVGLWIGLATRTGEAGAVLGWSFVVLFPLTLLLWVVGAVLIESSRA